ncbi:MAG TPA: SCP2 sterol-binding domain-containing protein [Methylophilus sp.]|nr:SCP2 sterol-binding domain-containing protein [Methylophilus sp.]
MFKPLIQFVLQHLMQQNDWTAPLLQPYANQTLGFDFKVTQVNLTILPNGELAVAADSATVDATIHLPPSLVMRLMRKDPLAASLIKIDGDVALGIEVGKILSAVRWDVEGDLSKVVGDIAAYQVVELGQEKFKQLQANARNLGEMLVEYWQEEQPLIAKKTSIEHFNQSVDRLREDADRLQSRVDNLLAASPSSESR